MDRNMPDTDSYPNPNEVFVLQSEGIKAEFRKADVSDAELLIHIYDAAFYSDYIRYGECPAYGRTKERMEQSVRILKILTKKTTVGF